ncbi:hydroxyacid dehydrogenase, partial [Streptomyces sp. WAC05292]
MDVTPEPQMLPEPRRLGVLSRLAPEP